jgi:hypothetical protein
MPASTPGQEVTSAVIRSLAAVLDALVRRASLVAAERSAALA